MHEVFSRWKKISCWPYFCNSWSASKNKRIDLDLSLTFFCCPIDLLTTDWVRCDERKIKIYLTLLSCFMNVDQIIVIWIKGIQMNQSVQQQWARTRFILNLILGSQRLIDSFPRNCCHQGQQIVNFLSHTLTCFFSPCSPFLANLDILDQQSSLLIGFLFLCLFQCITMGRTGLSSRVETNSKENQLRQRRNRKKSIPTNPEVSRDKFSIFQWFQRRFMTSTSESTHSQEQTTTKHRKRFYRPSCTCRDICCKLFFLFALAYLIMYLRPDYSLYVRDSVENVLKKFNLTSEEFRLRPGQRLIGIRKPSMPIVIIPGIISTSLELWQGEKCAEGRFRHRFWTSIQMVDNIGRDYQCWLRHISLNLTTW